MKIAPFWSQEPAKQEDFLEAALGPLDLAQAGWRMDQPRKRGQEPAGLAILVSNNTVYDSTVILPYIYTHIWCSVDWVFFCWCQYPHLFPPRTPKKTLARHGALQEKQDWDQFKANEELFGVQSSYNEAAHSVWIDPGWIRGFVNVPFWGIWTSPSSICWRLDPFRSPNIWVMFN